MSLVNLWFEGVPQRGNNFWKDSLERASLACLSHKEAGVAEVELMRGTEGEVRVTHLDRQV
jgi:hypothetical protein